MLLILGGSVICSSPAFAQSAPARLNMKALYGVVGRMYGIDQDLLEAIAEVESGENPEAVSNKGAVGLMQLMPATASDFSVQDSFDPVCNLLGAAGFIDYLRGRIRLTLGRADLPDLLASYNAGPGAVERFGGVPPYRETHDYVRKVLSRYAARVAAESRLGAARGVRTKQVVVVDQPLVYRSERERENLLVEQLSEIRRQRARFIRGSSGPARSSAGRRDFGS